MLRSSRRTADCHLPFAICHLPFAICHLPFAICHLPASSQIGAIDRGIHRRSPFHENDEKIDRTSDSNRVSARIDSVLGHDSPGSTHCSWRRDGAVAGAVLTGGSGIGTVGGAAIGGVIGNQMGGRR
jgi:hypothetical protein